MPSLTALGRLSRHALHHDPWRHGTESLALFLRRKAGRFISGRLADMRRAHQGFGVAGGQGPSSSCIVGPGLRLKPREHARHQQGPARPESGPSHSLTLDIGDLDIGDLGHLGSPFDIWGLGAWKAPRDHRRSEKPRSMAMFMASDDPPQKPADSAPLSRRTPIFMGCCPGLGPRPCIPPRRPAMTDRSTRKKPDA